VNNINITTGSTQNLTVHKHVDSDVVQAIVSKLGYTAEEVRRWINKDDHNYVSILYNKLRGEKEADRNSCTGSTDNLSARVNLQPSFVPSVTSLHPRDVSAEKPRDQLLQQDKASFGQNLLANSLKFYTQPPMADGNSLQQIQNVLNRFDHVFDHAK
jgi:hypothetical protein